MELITEAGKKEPHAVDETRAGEGHRKIQSRWRRLCCVERVGSVRVKNVKDTSDEISPYKHEWIGYWQDKTWLRVPTTCANVGCNNKDAAPEIVGAHVRIVVEPNNDKNAWIVPLCKSCNSSENKAEMKLSDGMYMARVVMSKPHETVE